MTPFRPYQWSFWSAYAIHMRPYLLFVSGIAGLTGISYAVDSSTSLFWTIVVGCACFLGYGVGQALTDCTQIDTDSISAPYRPLSKGTLTAHDVAIVSIVGLLAVSVVFIIGNTWNVVLGGCAVAGLASYTFFKRRWWWTGPVWNSWIVALLPWIGFLAVESIPSNAIQDKSLWSLSGATAISYASFVIVGYLKDISADRVTGYRTFPVVFGWRPTVMVGDALQLIAALWFAFLCIEGTWMSWIAWSIGTVLALRGQISLPRRNNAREDEAATGIAATVESFVWWGLAVMITNQPTWWWFAIIYGLAFEFTLRRRPSSAQI